MRTRSLRAVVALVAAIMICLTMSAVAAAAPGPRDTVVILFNFTNDTSKPVTATQVKDWMFGNAQSVNAWVKEDSGNTVSLRGLASATGDVFGWYTIGFSNKPEGSDTCVTDATLEKWRAAAVAKTVAAGRTVTGAEHVIFAMPTVPNMCAGAFMGRYFPGTNEIMLVGRNTLDYFHSTLTHELSHALPPYSSHANGWDCKNGTEVVPIAISGSCVTESYGDYMAALGQPANSYLNNNVHRARLGYFPAANIVHAPKATPAFYSLKPSSPVLASGGGTQVLKIDRGAVDAAAYRWMYLEYRQRWGVFDGMIPSTRTPGIDVRVAKDLALIDNTVTKATTHLLDATPWTPWVHAAPDKTQLELGDALYDAVGNFSIRLVSLNSTAAQISINPGVPTGSQGTVSVSGGQLNFAATAGRTNILSISRSGANYMVYSPYPVGGALTAGTGCTASGSATVICAAAGVTRARIDLGDEEDAIRSLPDLPTTVLGGAGDDVIQGGINADVIDGGAGNDQIYGNAGSDTISGGTGLDQLRGDADGDKLDYSYATDRVGVNMFLGQAEADGVTESIGGFEDVTGGPGNDYISGSSATNLLDGGAGADNIYGEGGNDLLLGGPGGVGDNDQFYGGDGFDTVSYSARTTPVYASLNTLADDGGIAEGDNAGYGVEGLNGGSGADVIYGSETADQLKGNGGIDSIFGLGGNDWLDSRDGVNDGTLDCGAGSDTLLADLLMLDPLPMGCETVGRG